MLKIIVKQVPTGIRENWLAMATVSGRCVRVEARIWYSGRTKKEALRKLKNTLHKEVLLMGRASNRIAYCAALAEHHERLC